MEYSHFLFYRPCNWIHNQTTEPFNCLENALEFIQSIVNDAIRGDYRLTTSSNVNIDDLILIDNKTEDRVFLTLSEEFTVYTSSQLTPITFRFREKHTIEHMDWETDCIKKVTVDRDEIFQYIDNLILKRIQSDDSELVKNNTSHYYKDISIKRTTLTKQHVPISAKIYQGTVQVKEVNNKNKKKEND